MERADAYKERSYRQVKLECGDSLIDTLICDYPAGAKGQEGDPVDLTRNRFKGIRSSDLIKASSYHGEQVTIVTVTREGRVIAVARYWSDGHDGWLLSQLSQCKDSDLDS